MTNRGFERPSKATLQRMWSESRRYNIPELGDLIYSRYVKDIDSTFLVVRMLTPGKLATVRRWSVQKRVKDETKKNKCWSMQN